MSTRTLTPDDPHAPRERRRVLPWTFLIALVLAPVLVAAGVAAGADNADDAGVALALFGFACGLYAIFGAPVYLWGPSGLLFTLGVLVVIAGFAGAVGTRVVEDATTEYHRGDDDGDGQTDEDGFGDADNSENDPTQISGVCELTDHEDDDADCETDEDPAPIYETKSEVRTSLAVSRDLSIGAVVLGLILLGAFALVQNTRRPDAAPAPPAHGATTTTRRDGGER